MVWAPIGEQPHNDNFKVVKTSSKDLTVLLTAARRLCGLDSLRPSNHGRY